MAFKNDLTDNKKANFIIMGVAMLGYIVAYIAGVVPRSMGADKIPLIEGIVFMVTYLFSSYYFSPDLDLRHMRVGHHSFPIHSSVFKYLRKKRGRAKPIAFLFDLIADILTAVHVPINRFWRIYWQPFAAMFTHRGAVHWPIWGAQLRILWIYSTIYVSIRILDVFSIVDVSSVSKMISNDGYIESVKLLYKTILSSSVLMAAWIAIMVSDICHTAIDYMDTMRKGSKNFIPPASIAPRGELIKAFKFILGIKKD